jgi:hypothetical protein
MMELAIWLIFAHLYGDVILRTPFIAKYKGKSLLVAAFHCFMWAGCVSVPLRVYGKFTVTLFLFLFIGHMFVDFAKALVEPCGTWEDEGRVKITKYGVIDQALHFVQLGVVWL